MPFKWQEVNVGECFCFLGQSSALPAHPGHEFKAISVLTSSSNSLKSLCSVPPPLRLTMWDNKISKKKIKHIIISSASLPTFRHHCNSASDVNIWAWFSFNGFNNKIQSNVNNVFNVFICVMSYHVSSFQHKSIWGRKGEKRAGCCFCWTEECMKVWLCASEWSGSAITEREPERRLLGHNRTLWARSSWHNTLWKEREGRRNINKLQISSLHRWVI